MHMFDEKYLKNIFYDPSHAGHTVISIIMLGLRSFTFASGAEIVTVFYSRRRKYDLIQDESGQLLNIYLSVYALIRLSQISSVVISCY